MAVIHMDFFSSVLGMTSTVSIVMPQDVQPGEKLPVLYMLHGLSDNENTWLRQTTLEYQLSKYRMCVVMPNVHRSFYSDMAHGAKYWTYVSEELPKIVKAMFPISDRREDTFAAGLSMGGYGAMKLALAHPDRYAAAASFSGALDIRAIENLFVGSEFTDIFGDLADAKEHKDDLFHLANVAARSGKELPALYQCCGTEDFLYADNIRFLNHLKALGVELTYEEEPGLHEWGYWNMKLPRVLEFLTGAAKKDAVLK
ncbi:alpha/beta hydrolase family protein [Paenibacillus sp. CF384]|uniref:alpha/beta hydrolase n=1 Tax=Paenibacillus sp. CF384 TaxID=1884382 RepID=UPI0008989536|nr:alpha/beta hydrolase family protein [Paenibacillus sp. CF384]SDX14669.1 S-formylglutathione hydrolase FrmB [Paenibacillus sp. CF384]